MRITVNHLTRMKAPYVCVAGIDSFGDSIRPVLQSERLPRSVLASQGGTFQLGSVVDIGNPKPRPVVPEVEDVAFDVRTSRVIERLDDSEFLDVLQGDRSDSLRSIFGHTLGRMSGTAAALPQHTGIGSLGVLKLDTARLTVKTYYDKTNIRLHFSDSELGDLAIKVNDLRLWEENQVDASMGDIERIKGVLDGCFVAVGLTRAYSVSSYPGLRHWLQVNNVFPVEDPLWARE